jgi:hypothetical protein
VKVFFIDGCKGWYGTKHFAREATTATTAKSWLIFQGYGWYTCFWLPSLVRAWQCSCTPFLRGQHLRGSNHPESASGRDRRAIPPIRPRNGSKSELLGRPAARRRPIADPRAEVVHELQHTAALAYGGEFDLIDAASRASTCRLGGELVRL